MDMATIAQLIGSLGFPIVACGALAWFIYQQNKSHKEEMDKMSEAINNNTLVLNKLLIKFEGVQS